MAFVLGPSFTYSLSWIVFQFSSEGGDGKSDIHALNTGRGMNVHNWASHSHGSCLERDTSPSHKQLMDLVRFLEKRIPSASIAGRVLRRERGNSRAERIYTSWGKVKQLKLARETVTHCQVVFRRGLCFDFISKYANKNYTGRKAFKLNIYVMGNTVF